MKIAVIDLFCGIGGLSYGFKQEGIPIIAGIDSDASCKYAFETNVEASFLALDVTNVTGRRINELFRKDAPDFRVLVGCAPCQPFSIYTGRYRKEECRTDNRWQLLEEFARLAREVRPDVISMENVPRVTLHPVFSQFVEQLRTANYHVSYKKIRCEQFGVPQRRTRLVLFASRIGEVKFPAATHAERPITVRQTIGKLPPLKAGEACATDRLHVGRNLSPKNLKRLQATKEGGSWKDWEPELRLSCHNKEKGKSFRSVYGRMRWDEPSPVITTQCLGIGNGRFGHPEQDRAITIREAALLQSFPKRFRFVPPDHPINGAQLARQIGNAVPVRLGRIIARTIKTHLAEHWAEPL